MTCQLTLPAIFSHWWRVPGQLLFRVVSPVNPDLFLFSYFYGKRIRAVCLSGVNMNSFIAAENGKSCSARARNLIFVDKLKGYRVNYLINPEKRVREVGFWSGLNGIYTTSFIGSLIFCLIFLLEYPERLFYGFALFFSS